MLTLPKERVEQAKRKRGNGIGLTPPVEVSSGHSEGIKYQGKIRDVFFRDERENYLIRNVPYQLVGEEGQETYDAQVALTVATLHELMRENRIPHEVDFQQFSDIEF